jgi:hypothetical protein
VPASVSAATGGWYRRLLHGWMPPSVSQARLEADLPIYRVQLATLLAEVEAARPPVGADGAARRLAAWAAEIETLLADCDAALRQRDAEKAWRCFKTARRTELFLVSHVRPSAVRTRAWALREEAGQKLAASWRGRSILETLKERDGQAPSVDEVVDAARLLDDHHDNQYQRLAIVARRLGLLTLATGLALAGWLVFAPGLRGADPAAPLAWGRGYWLAVMLMGFIGALVSGFVATDQRSAERAIPLQLLGSQLIYARLALGTLSAVAAATLLASGIVTLLRQPLSPELVLAAAFVAGFSERFVVRAVESAAGAGGSARDK